jgi:hypothetical protein
MRRRSARVLTAAALMAGIFGCAPDAGLPRSEQTVEGVTIYLGVVPAALVQGHSTTPGNPQALHGGTPAGSDSHHVMVALFDAASGARITDARVSASVRGQAPARVLEPMEVNGLTTYGNFFVFSGREVRRIHVEVFPTGRSSPIEANFAYEHQPGT